ncbi:fumarate hydratase [Pseudobacteroides cellulosolvens]|uniref:Hydro-lyase, Fe-S type, tartrate/fumarate subfamily, alpha subunit n=1 Tax=Pseudobacteroides cellulosolvens ATCC 35603 = DSM 2933 TaxID=398512 RepID=A0A0L6JRU7_9FIRM|nr:fumarate hydratase [Pseudobacteroides cellulosolvens]KNY28566.1 hydro-lyase, Fe-S type, tartrate/fumarate subfamily, alpha subunit [Pseudobacteroides cellulosolvens ATCC 35603 = DSM 2933]
MKTITTEEISAAVEKLCINANYYLNYDIANSLESGLVIEESDTGKEVLKQLLENAIIAKEENMAICQDTGMAVIFIDIGQEVSIVNGNLTDAINEGVRNGYQKGYLRKSVVSDPLIRQNTGDNTPAVIHYNITDGDKLKIIVAPKGFGSENMSSLKMLKPSDGLDGVKKFILDTVSNAGPNPCPPIVVGVGIGGTMEKAAILAKKALLRPINEFNPLLHIKELEEEMLSSINKLGIGPAGLGGKVTALGLNIEIFPTHIAGLPVAVNINCHATRHAEIIL